MQAAGASTLSRKDQRSATPGGAGSRLRPHGQRKQEAEQQQTSSDEDESEFKSADSGSEGEHAYDSDFAVVLEPPSPRQQQHDGSSAGTAPAGGKLAPAAGKRGLQQGAQPAAAAQVEAEAEDEDRPARKRRSSGDKQPSYRRKKQTAAPAARGKADEAQSPVAQAARQRKRQQRQQQSRSPTPVAAAPPLEMSAPPASAGKADAVQPQQPGLAAAQFAADPHQQQQQQHGGREGGTSGAADPACAARECLVRRLKAPRSQEAATMQLRPRLQARKGPGRLGWQPCVHAISSWRPLHAAGLPGCLGRPAAVGGSPQDVLGPRHGASRRLAAGLSWLSMQSRGAAQAPASQASHPCGSLVPCAPQEAHDSLLESLTNTVELGHNNSLLVVGPRGCGKTLVRRRGAGARGMVVWGRGLARQDGVGHGGVWVGGWGGVRWVGVGGGGPAATCSLQSLVWSWRRSDVCRQRDAAPPTGIPPSAAPCPPDGAPPPHPPAQVTERALAALQARFNRDPRDPVVGVVRLSGLAHSQEVAAFKEASRQLCQ